MSYRNWNRKLTIENFDFKEYEVQTTIAQYAIATVG